MFYRLAHKHGQKGDALLLPPHHVVDSLEDRREGRTESTGKNFIPIKFYSDFIIRFYSIGKNQFSIASIRRLR